MKWKVEKSVIFRRKDEAILFQDTNIDAEHQLLSKVLNVNAEEY